MTKLDQNLSEIFDVEPLKESTGNIIDTNTTPLTPIANTPVVVDNKDDIEMEEDFAKLRANTQDLLLKGKIALDCALDIVQQSDQPRAIEVFSTLLGQVSKINQDAMDLHGKRREIKNARPESDAPQTINNNAIFVGSTAELSKMLTDLGKKNAA